MIRGRWAVASVAAVVGYGLLALTYPRLSPAVDWRYTLTRDQAIRAARSVAARLGTDVSGWTPSYTVLAPGDVSLQYRRTGSMPAEIEAFVPPVHSHVFFAQPADGRTVHIRLGNDERPTAFTDSRPPAAASGSQSSLELARAALAALLDAGTYSRIAAQHPSPSKSDNGEQFTFAVPSAANPSEVAINAEVTVRNRAVRRAAIGPTFTEQYRNRLDQEDLALRVLSIPSIVLVAIVWPAAVTFTILSMARRELDWRSSVGFVVMLLVLSAVPIAAGSREYARVRGQVQPATGVTVSTDQGQRSTQVGQRVGQALWVWNPLLLVFVPFWAAGYPLGRRAAPALVVTARDFFGGRLTRQTVGRAVAAGVLCGGVFAAVPYVVAAANISPYVMLDTDGLRPYALGYRHPAVAAVASALDATSVHPLIPMPSSLTLQRSIQDGVAVIAVDGFLDAHTAPQFEQMLQQEIEDGRVRLVIDCAKLTYISSAGLGVFMGFIEEVRERQGDIKICGLTPKVKQVFEILGFETIFEIVENVRAALARFGADSNAPREAR